MTTNAKLGATPGTTTDVETVSSQRAFGGTQGVYRHASALLGCTMEFSVFTPPGDGPFPVLWYLSGLTCTQENATTKAGFQRIASALGIMIVCPDTSPRGDDIANDDAYDLGQGAGFYLTATEAPWAPHYKMDAYVLDDLTAVIAAAFPADMTRQGITGHSMGGHGALTLYLKNRARFRSVSAFAPIVNPTAVPWGQKAFTAYLGTDSSTWAQYDSCMLLASLGADDTEWLIDIGTADPFLAEQLTPEALEAACKQVGQALRLRRQDGYDHSYYLMASFIEDHLRHHAAALKA